MSKLTHREDEVEDSAAQKQAQDLLRDDRCNQRVTLVSIHIHIPGIQHSVDVPLAEAKFDLLASRRSDEGAELALD